MEHKSDPGGHMNPIPTEAGAVSMDLRPKLYQNSPRFISACAMHPALKIAPKYSLITSISLAVLIVSFSSPFLIHGPQPLRHRGEKLNCKRSSRLMASDNLSQSSLLSCIVV